MCDEQKIISLLTACLRDYLKDTASLVFKKNSTGTNSIVVYLTPSVYRSDEEKEILLAKVKLSGKDPYISFSSRYAPLFKSENIAFDVVASQPIIRIDLSLFERLLSEQAPIDQILKAIFSSLFSFDTFGCCSRNYACSDAKKCIHPDPIFAMSCQYKKNLDVGNIFYGENRNINA